jgi:hypothetical protein
MFILSNAPQILLEDALGNAAGDALNPLKITAVSSDPHCPAPSCPQQGILQRELEEGDMPPFDCGGRWHIGVLPRHIAVSAPANVSVGLVPQSAFASSLIAT